MPGASDTLRVTNDFTLRLCALLRSGGVAVGTQQTIACMQAIVLVAAVDEDELRSICSTTLINRKQDLWQLHRAFDLLLQHFAREDLGVDPAAEQRAPVVVQRRLYSEDSGSTTRTEAAARTEGYSDHEVDHTKDFRLIAKRDMPAARAALRKIARKHASMKRRDSKPTARHGRLDLRASMRDSVKHDGEIIKLRFRRRKPTRSRFVIAADVSGSMEIYSIFLLNFLHAMNATRRLKIETFVFSTRLECLTKPFQARNFEEMAHSVTQQFSAWSGGTKIGAAIQALNETHATKITPKSTVVIMSDGWDTGDITLLADEMAKLRRRAKAIVWINPLKGAPDYEPLAIGMAAAYPYCDQLIAGHSIESFETFAGVLSG